MYLVHLNGEFSFSYFYIISNVHVLPGLLTMMSITSFSRKAQHFWAEAPKSTSSRKGRGGYRN